MSNKYKLVYYPDKGLYTATKPVTEFNEELKQELGLMMELMRDSKGVGLAANQIGIDKSMFIMQTKDKIQEFINPVIKEAMGTQYSNEGCLSMPGVYLQLTRPKEVYLNAYNENGEPIEMVLVDQEVVIVSHEMEHLKGEFFLDNVNRQQKRNALRTYEKYNKQFGKSN